MIYAILSPVSLEGRKQAMNIGGWDLQMNLGYFYTDTVKE